MRAFDEVDTHPTVAAAAVAWSQEVQVVGADGRPHPTMRCGVTDVRVFGMAAVIRLTVAAVACAVHAHRAARIRPAGLLRLG